MIRMKRSQFFAQRQAFWAAEAKLGAALTRDDAAYAFPNRDCLAAEAAGVVWDPEKPDLPERLCRGFEGSASTLLPAASSGSGWRGYSEEAIEAAYDEAVRRFNAWPELRHKALALMGYTPDASHANDTARELLAILDGAS